MSVRPHIDVEGQRKAEEQLNRQLARVYLMWLVGIIAGAVQLRPEKVELGGVAYRIENPDVLQGIIFVGCLVYYIAIISNIIRFGIETTVPNRALRRRMIYLALGTRRTLMGKDKTYVVAVKSTARFLAFLSSTFFFIYFFLPLLHIFIFRQAAFFKGIDAVFQTASVQDNTIVLTSTAVAVASFVVLCLWTLFLANRFKMLSGVDAATFVCFSAGITFALVDNFIRGQEDLYTTITRVGALEFIVFAIWFLGLMLIRSMYLWLNLRLWVAKWKLKRLQSRSKQ